MARKKSSGIDKARQAISRTLKGAVKENRKRAKKLSRQWQRMRKAALKQARRNKDKDLVAQWRALKRFGYLDTIAPPALKNLTPSRRRAISSAFRKANSQGTFKNGRVERPLQRTVITTTTKYRNERGYEYEKVSTRIKYGLGEHFKMVRTKNKPSTEAGLRRTKKGYVVEVESPLSKVRITKSGKVVEKTVYEKGGIEVSREGITGTDILRLVESIENGKFTIPRNTAIKLDNFGSIHGRAYQWDGLDGLAERVRYYEKAMPGNVLEHWLKTTELHIIRVTP